MNRKIWLVTILVGLVLTIWLMGVIGQELKAKREAGLRVEQLGARVSEEEELRQRRLVLDSQLKELKNFLIDDETGVALVAKNMEELAERSSVSLILEFDDFPKQIDVGGSYRRALETKATVEGSYQGILAWVREVEKLPYFINLTEVKLSLPRLGVGVKAEFEGYLFLKGKDGK